MMDMIFELIKRVVEKDEKSRKFAVMLADSYLRRISRFQDQLVLLGIFLNVLTLGFVLSAARDCVCPLTFGVMSCLGIFGVNVLLAKRLGINH